MSESSGYDRPITSEEIISDMLADAIGMDNPMTDEAMAAGEAVVQARIDMAKSWLNWKPGDPELDCYTYDSQALAALTVRMTEED